jgi:hypothetical protein
MKPTLFALVLAPFLLAGCSSVSSLSDYKHPSGVLVDDDARPVASYFVWNHSYKLLGCVPLSTGNTWKGGPPDYFNVEWFADHCTLDENLASVKAAAKQCGTDRVCGLVTTEDTSWIWSLFLVKHTEIKTSCILCEPAGDNR